MRFNHKLKPATMNATEFSQKLTTLNACSEAREWAEGKDLATAWARCERGDWMIWLAQTVGVELRPLTGAKAACAEFARPYITDPRSLAALDTAHAFGRGECSADELAAAADSAAAAAAAYAAAAYAADAAAAAAPYEDYAGFTAPYADPVAGFAAVAVAAAADYSNSENYAADAAAAYAGFATRAAADSTADGDLARTETLRKCADEVRKHITIEILLQSL